MTDWRNRIKETRTVRVEDIQPHPSNWRRHPQAQESAIRGLLAQVGIVAPVVAYESELYGGLVLLDGHLRQETGGEWPCVVLDVTDAEADIILASFDPITGLAEMDAQALAELLGRVDMQAIEDDGLAGLLEELAEGEHLCMTMRGIQTPALMKSSVTRGLFRDSDSARAEFLSLCRRVSV